MIHHIEPFGAIPDAVKHRLVWRIKTLANTQMEPTCPTVLCDSVTAARGSFATLGCFYL
jgi:hypothetical protein